MNDRTSDACKYRPGLEYGCVLFAAALLYAISMAPGALWQDNGMAQIRVLQHDYVGRLGLALAHPLVYFFAQALQFLPLKESALKTNLVSPIFGALPVANFYLLIRMLPADRTRFRMAAVIAALSLALAHTFWQHASLVEVYSVSTFFLTIELVLLAQFTRTGHIHWWLMAIFFNGLECTNHVLALITLASIIIWSIWLMVRGSIKAWWIIPAVLLWMIGCLPYEYMGFQAWRQGMTAGSVIHSMLFGEYQKQVLNVHINLRLLVTTIAVIVLNFPTPNLLLVPVGLIRGKSLIVSGLYPLLILATVFHLTFAVRYPVTDQYTFFIIPVLFLAIWLGIGAMWFMTRFPRKAVFVVVLASISPIVYFFTPAIVAHLRFLPAPTSPTIPYRNEFKYFFQPWKTGYHGAEKLVDEVFAMAGPDAIVIADSTSSRPFIYYQLAQNRRTDIRVVPDLYDSLPDDQKIRKLSEELKHHQVFVIRPYPKYCPQWILNYFALSPQRSVYRVTELKKIPTKEIKDNQK